MRVLPHLYSEGGGNLHRRQSHVALGRRDHVGVVTSCSSDAIQWIFFTKMLEFCGEQR
jgi:hypothetical protein